MKNIQVARSSIHFLLFVIAAFGLSSAVSASVVLDGTRVIYPEDKSEVTVRMTNEGEEPKLVQVWIDDGDKQATPDTLRVPFVVTTPIFRMDPKKGQVAKIQYTKSMPVPSDRESVYWLNVLEIPAKPTAIKDENYLQFRYRTRIKVFLRPKGLEGIANDAPGKLNVKYKPGHIQIENPTPYHISINSLEVGANADGGVIEAVMLTPHSTENFELKNSRVALKTPAIKFKSVNDYGGAPVWEKTATDF